MRVLEWCAAGIGTAMMVLVGLIIGLLVFGTFVALILWWLVGHQG